MELASQIGGDMEIGRWHVSELRRFSMLRTNHRVLDVGCGVGRTARWLVPFLADGSYEGFDISQPAIEWCQREITSQHPNFRFMHIDLANAAYNPAGKLRADELVFPYADEDFDLVCLFSVFTHLCPTTSPGI